MSLINKSSVLSQLQTRLSEIDPSITSSEDLLFFLKTAQNASSDATDIVSELSTRIGVVDVSDDIKELVVLASSLSLITSDRIVSVPSTTERDAFTDALPGTVIFVQSENVPYIRKSDDSWVLIDPSLQPEFLVAQPNAYAWGSNSFGQLGDNTTVSKSSPVSVIGGYADWIQVGETSAGNNIALIRANGTLWTQGIGAGIGDGTVVAKSSPVSVAGGFTDWVQVAVSNGGVAAVRADGTTWGWGGNSFGQLGDNSTVAKSSPVSVVGGFTDWVQVTKGQNHTVGIRANGTAWAWGQEFSGKLGNNLGGMGGNRSSPVSVVGGFTDWTQVSAGQSHTLGIRANGTAWAWGAGARGELGDGLATYLAARSSPVSVVGGFTDWIQVSGSSSHSLGLRANGTAWAWGCNASGRLGTNNTIIRTSPVAVVGGFTDWIQLSAGTAHSLGLRADGTAWAWGNNVNGQLGDNSATDRSSPVSVVGGFTDWVQVSAGGTNSVGIKGG